MVSPLLVIFFPGEYSQDGWTVGSFTCDCLGTTPTT